MSKDKDRFPKDCWEKKCEHFRVWDMSIDDMCCFCNLLKLESDYRGNLTATFYKPKGKKPIVRHYLDDIMIDNTGRNLNRTEIIKQLI